MAQHDDFEAIPCLAGIALVVVAMWAVQISRGIDAGFWPTFTATLWTIGIAGGGVFALTKYTPLYLSPWILLGAAALILAWIPVLDSICVEAAQHSNFNSFGVPTRDDPFGETYYERWFTQWWVQFPLVAIPAAGGLSLLWKNRW